MFLQIKDMTYVLTALEKALIPLNKTVVIAAATDTIVGLDFSTNNSQQLSLRIFRNTGANPVYFNVNGPADNVTEHVKLCNTREEYQAFHMMEVHAWSALGTTIATEQYQRGQAQS